MVFISDKLDRRKKYTQMVLKQSLMETLREKPIASITVKEICDFADVNRSTFYAHYLDLFDLLEQVEEELIEEMDMFLSAYNVEKEDEALKMTEKLIEYFASKQKECQILLSKHSNSSFEQKVRIIARRYIMKNQEEAGCLSEATLEYRSAFMISGSIEVMKVWLNNDMDQSPKEIARLITELNEGSHGSGKW